MRCIRIYEHSENYVSLYYFLADSALHKFLRGMKAQILRVINVDCVPSYLLYERIKKRISLINDVYGTKTIINSFNEGFSVIMPKSYLKWIENLFEDIEYEEDFILQQIEEKRKVAKT